jgi:hypothetical protein
MRRNIMVGTASLGLWACTGPEDAGESSPPTTQLEAPPPSTYIFEAGDPPAPTATLADIQGALQEALDLTLTIHAQPVQAAYTQAMTGSTSACPYVYITPDGSYWYDTCTASDGTEFDGYVFAYEVQGLYDPYSGMTYDYWYAFGGATVQDPDGHTLELAGGAVTLTARGSYGGTEMIVYQTDVGGTFRWDGVEADGTWLESGIEPDLVAYTTAFPSLEQSTTTVYGGFGGFGDGWAVAFDENVIGGELLGLPCQQEVSGTLGIRAPDGSWYDIRFHGSDGTDEAYDTAQCDGCGEVFYQGEPVGEVCVDASTLLTMGVQPW